MLPHGVQVIVTDQYPVDLSYVPNLDQAWVLNWRSTKDDGIKTIQVTYSFPIKT